MYMYDVGQARNLLGVDIKSLVSMYFVLYNTAIVVIFTVVTLQVCTVNSSIQAYSSSANTYIQKHERKVHTEFVRCYLSGC